MERAKFEPDGSYQLIIRPEPVLFNKTTQTPNLGLPSILNRKFIMLKKQLLAVTGLTLASVGAANAAIPTAVTDAITTAGTDAATVGSAVLVVIVGIKAFKWIRRAL